MSEDDSARARALEALGQVVDPELGLDVVELGLVYRIDAEGRRVRVQLTMTTPACPLGELIVQDAESCLRSLGGFDDVGVELLWDPPWTPERMSLSARRSLGWGA